MPNPPFSPPHTLCPTFEQEATLWAQGYRRVAGIDEAGRGALAGPVVAAAVIASPHTPLAGVWAAVRDSKQLSPAQRAQLADAIRAEALAWGVGMVACTEIDAVGIAEASRRAMIEAVRALDADVLLIDWVRLPALTLPQQSFVKADATIVSVAAASILAKTARDQIMVALAREFPAYGFDGHKGYGTAAHLAAIARSGPCAQHRLTFAPLRTQSLTSDEPAQVRSPQPPQSHA